MGLAGVGCGWQPLAGCLLLQSVQLLLLSMGTGCHNCVSKLLNPVRHLTPDLTPGWATGWATDAPLMHFQVLAFAVSLTPDLTPGWTTGWTTGAPLMHFQVFALLLEDACLTCTSHFGWEKWKEDLESVENSLPIIAHY